MTATPDAPDHASPDAGPDAGPDPDEAGRARRRAERVAALAFMVDACRTLAGPARDEAQAGDRQAGAFLLALAREIRQSVALMERIDPTARPKPRPRKPEPEAAARSEARRDGAAPPPSTPPAEPWPAEDPRKQHLRDCVRLVAVGTSPTEQRFAELYVAIEARLDAPDIAADIAEGRAATLLVTEICADLGIEMNDAYAWPAPPPWGPGQPPGEPRSRLRTQAGRDPPHPAAS